MLRISIRVLVLALVFGLVAEQACARSPGPAQRLPVGPPEEGASVPALRSAAVEDVAIIMPQEIPVAEEPRLMPVPAYGQPLPITATPEAPTARVDPRDVPPASKAPRWRLFRSRRESATPESPAPPQPGMVDPSGAPAEPRRGWFHWPWSSRNRTSTEGQ